jgi:SpoVK/Ycf46/Vps4 family AAA+-type ATPase
MTTNSIQTLQQMSAAMRPGRIDYMIEFKNATPEQVKGMFMMFYADFKKSDWKECTLQDLEEDFKKAFHAAFTQVDLLKPSDRTDGDTDALHHDGVSIGDLSLKRLHLYEHRISHLERIREKVSEIAFAEPRHGAERKHWLNALASIAGNHFQSKLHKYSMAQIEKFFQNMILGHKRTCVGCRLGLRVFGLLRFN